MSNIGPKWINKSYNLKNHYKDKEEIVIYPEIDNSYRINAKSIYHNDFTLKSKINETTQKNSKNKNMKDSKMPTPLKTNVLNIFRRAKNFAANIKKIIFYDNIKNLNNVSKAFLSDPCYFDIKEEEKKTKKENSFFYRLYLLIQKFLYVMDKKCLNFPKIRSLNPDSKLKKFWDCLLLIFTFINFFVLSFEISYFFVLSMNGSKDISVTNNPLTLFDFDFLKIINLIFYFCDIVLCFITGYHEMGRIVYNYKKIKENYLKKLFIFDIIAYISTFLYVIQKEKFFIENHLYFLNILFIFIQKKFFDRLKSFQDFIIQEKEDWEDYFSIFLLYLKTLFVSHLMACVWYIVGDVNHSNENSWINQFGLLKASWATKYLNSLYWSLVTMLTVGYGDLTPKNEIEKIVCIFTMLIGFTVFGFTLGSICDIIQKMNNKSKELKENHKIITRLMKRNNVDFDFQFRVRKFMEYIHNEGKDYNKENEILNTLSRPIKEEFLNHIYGKKIKSIPFFAKNFSENCLKALSLIIKRLDIAPEEYLYRAFDSENNNFYFISKGSTELTLDRKKNLQIELTENNYFNLFTFITNEPEEFNVKTLKFCSFFLINRNEFIKLLKNDFPEDFEIFCKIKDEIIYDNLVSNLYYPCHCCQNKTHRLKTCPFLHYHPNQISLLAKHNYSQMNQRAPFQRKNHRKNKMNSLTNKRRLGITIDKISSDKPMLIRLYLEKFLDQGTRQDSFEGEDEPEKYTEFPNIMATRVESLSHIKSKNEIEDLNLQINSEKENEFSTNSIGYTTKKKLIIQRTSSFYYNKESIFSIADNICNIRKLFGINPKLNYDQLFDFDMDKKYNYTKYFPSFNFKESILKFKKFVRIRLRKFRALNENYY